MKRQVSLDEISDGRLYSRHDMVRIGCGGCRGCSACCHGMGTSAILDPLDVHRLVKGTGLPAEALFADKLELNVVDGIILPNLRMSRSTTNIAGDAAAVQSGNAGEAEEACGFLNSEGRCSIHPYRPGVCRLFPLGRYYEKKTTLHSTPVGEYPAQWTGCPRPTIEDWGISHAKRGMPPGEGHNPASAKQTSTECSASHNAPESDNSVTDISAQQQGEAISFSYFVQMQECPAPNKTKVRVEKWLDQPDLAGYEVYILKWHNFLERAEALVKSTTDEEEIKNINLYILKLFFLKPYDPQQNFYIQFEERMNAAREVLEV